VEFSPVMLGLARQLAQTLGRHIDLRLGDAQALDLPDVSFDAVVCTVAMRHSRERAVAEMKRVLWPGGCCYLTT
jgi:ubiquinone/menaquinone biosynthesis C-methylase UbiE